MAAPIVGSLQMDIDSTPALVAIRTLGQLASTAATARTAIRNFGAAVTAANQQMVGFNLRLSAMAASLSSIGAALAQHNTQIAAFGTHTNAASNRVHTLGGQLNRVGAAMKGATVAAVGAAAGISTIAANTGRADRATRSFGTGAVTAHRSYARSVNTSRDATQGFMSVVLRLALVFGGLRAAMASLQTIAVFEDFQDTFTALNKGDATLGNLDFRFAQKYARESAQTFEEIASAIIGLRNNNVEPTRELLRLFSDVAGATTDQRATFAALVRIWQRGQQGGLGVEELDIISNRGASVYPITLERLGVGRRGIGNLGQDIAGAQQILGALREGWEGIYGGITAARVDNLTVRWNAFTDALKQAAWQMGVGLGDAVKDTLDIAAERLDRNTYALQAVGQAFGFVVRQVGILMTGLSGLHNLSFGLSSWILGGIAGLFAIASVVKVFKLITPTAWIGSTLRAPGSMLAYTKQLRRELRVAQNFNNELDNMGAGFRERMALGLKIADDGASSFNAAAASTPNILAGAASAAGITGGGLWLKSKVATGISIGAVKNTRAYTASLSALGRTATAVKNPIAAAGVAVGTLTLGMLSFFQSRARGDLSFWEALGDNLKAVAGFFSDIAASVGMLVRYAAQQMFSPDLLDTLKEVAKLPFTGIVKAAEGLAYVLDYGAYLTIPGNMQTGRRPGEDWRSYLRRYQSGEVWRPTSAQHAALRSGGLALDPIPENAASAARRSYRRFHRTYLGDGFPDMSVADRLDAERRRRDRRGRMRQRGLDFLTARDNWELNGDPWEGSEFRDYMVSEWQGTVREVVVSSDRASAAVKSFARNLGEELHARVIDHAIGKPFRDLMTNVLDQIFEAITSKEWWSEGAGKGLGGLLSGAASIWSNAAGTGQQWGTPTGGASASSVWGGVKDAGQAIKDFWRSGEVPSASSGGYTGMMGRTGGVDGKGGRPWILHDDEYIVPGSSMRGGGGDIIFHNYGPPLTATERPGANAVDREFDLRVANAVATGPKTKRAMKAGYGLSQQAA